MSKIVDSQRRARDIKFIHAAARELGMDRAAYEDMLFSLTRHRSCGDLDFTALQRVKDHLRKCGAGSKRPSSDSGRTGEWAFVDAQPEHTRKQWRYLIVLCRQAGIERGKQRAWAEGIVRHMHGLGQEIKKPAPLWSGADLANVINAALYQAGRVKRRERA